MVWVQKKADMDWVAGRWWGASIALAKAQEIQQQVAALFLLALRVVVIAAAGVTRGGAGRALGNCRQAGRGTHCWRWGWHTHRRPGKLDVVQPGKTLGTQGGSAGGFDAGLTRIDFALGCKQVQRAGRVQHRNAAAGEGAGRVHRDPAVGVQPVHRLGRATGRL